MPLSSVTEFFTNGAIGVVIAVVVLIVAFFLLRGIKCTASYKRLNFQ